MEGTALCKFTILYVGLYRHIYDKNKLCDDLEMSLHVARGSKVYKKKQGYFKK